MYKDLYWFCEKEDYEKILDEIVSDENIESIFEVVTKKIKEELKLSKNKLKDKHEYEYIYYSTYSKYEKKKIYIMSQIFFFVLKLEYKEKMAGRLLARYTKIIEVAFEKEISKLSLSVLIDKICKVFAVDAVIDEKSYNAVLINIVEFLNYYPKILTQSPPLLELEIVKKPKLYVKIPVRVLRLILKKKFSENYLNGIKLIEDILKNKSDEYLFIVRNKLRKHIEEIANLASSQSTSLEGSAKIDLTSIPPCMKYLISELREGSNLEHFARFSLTAFLSAIGMSNDEILRLFSSSPDFNEKITEYQIKHITGETSQKKYRPPKCSTLRVSGLCINPDELCKEIKHPVTYYRRKRKKR